jgi:tetratricopeptide (TPR) repeat protein
MNTNRAYRRLFFTSSLLAVVLTPSVPGALEPERIARAVSVQGTVESQRAGRSEWTPLKLDEELSAGDTIRVGPRSRAVIALLDRSVLRLGEETTVTLRPPGPERSGVLDLLRGAVHFLTRGPRSLDVKTELVSVGVRGTEFLVVAESDQTSVTVFEGAVVAANAQGTLALSGGQSAVAQRGQAPVLRVVAKPRDAVRWALHYPPVLDVRPEDLAREPDRLTYRAQGLLAVGKVDEAAVALDQALAASPKDAAALSLQTIVAVVQNDRERALALGRAAVEAAPGSATAHLALSYALQARFDLDGARSSVARAVELDPKDALAWARLSELHASFGATARSLEAARRAAALAPDLSRTQTVLGFAHLRDVETSEARKAFERAIALDSADPLPRLGLGLTRIRTGDLDGGAREIEIAAGLAPNEAIIRSYLGKAYYEEKRTGLDEREWETAKTLDPNDPTPWFYGAIAKQTTNRPVEALRDLERSIELNDGRAVYRSRLLLDSDLAARSASLARIYGDLGFQQLALVEGWKSVEADPTSDSAHRLLADSYASLPRHEIARVSELLQAQLLQPINITPIQPHLAESNLFLLSHGGPGALSFNEFNPLFERDRVAAQLSAVGAQHATWGVEPVVAGIYRKLSFSLGYTHFETEGVRDNHDQKDDLFNGFVQAELASGTSVQAEYRHRTVDRGDLVPHFFPDEINPFRNADRTDTARVGARHAFSPESILLASGLFQQFDTRVSEDPNYEEKLHQRAKGGELQHLFRSRYVDLVSGAGYFDVDSTHDIRFVFDPGPPPGVFQTSLDQGVRHANAYVYAHLRPVPSLVLTLGASGDAVRSDFFGNREQLNPKVGVVWSPFTSTTLRAAAYRVLARTLIADQTIEPTQVAGFNQFFDEPNGPRFSRFGVAFDQKITRDLSAGAEGTYRDLTVTAIDATVSPVARTESEWKEYGARGYFFWTPHRMLALRAEYFFERLVRQPQFAFGATEVKTHRVPLGFAVFHSSGLSVTGTATYYNQGGTFGQFEPFRQGSDDFWVLDAALSYRLPKRYGVVAVGATNLLDEHFNLFESTNTNVNPAAIPARTVFARLTLAVP